MKKRYAVAAAFTCLLAVAVIVGCAGGSLFPGGGSTLHDPKFLVAMDDNFPSLANLHVFTVNPTTGAITEVSGSPFTTGLVDGYGAGVIVHPSHGNWVYVGDNDGNVQALTIGANGTPTSTSFATSPGLGWVNGGLAITQDGKFLYTTTDGTDVVVWSIDQNTGALTKMGTYTTPTETCTYGVATFGNFVYINDNCSYTVQVASRGANGMLSDVQTVAVPNTGSSLWTVRIDKTGKFLYVGDESETFTRYTIGSDGKLTLAGTNTLTCCDMDSFDFTADNKFLISTTDDTGTAVWSVNQSTGDLTQITGSPFGTEDSYGTVTVDPSSKFVYVSDDCSHIVAYNINASTGALTAVPGSPFAAPGGCSYGFAVTW